MTSNRSQKTSAWRAAVALPAVVLIGLGGSALLAAPALAETAPPTDPATSTTSPAPTDATTPDPAATTPTQTSTAAPSPSATGSTPKPKALTTVTKLKVSSPTPVDLFSDDEPTPVEVDSRTFDIVGTAPSGSKLYVDDFFGDFDTHIATYTVPAGTTTFSIPVTFADDSPFNKVLDVYGKNGRSYLDDVFLDVNLPAETSVAPVLNAPTVTSFSVAPLPFDFGTIGKPVKLTGTGTPGEYVQLFFAKPGTKPDTTTFDQDGYDEAGSELGGQFSYVKVGTTGSWTAYAYLLYGTTSVFAGEQQLAFDADDFPLGAVTHISPLSASTDITLTEPAGTVDAPVITKPADPDDLDGGFVVSSGSASISSSISSSVSSSVSPSQATRGAAPLTKASFATGRAAAKARLAQVRAAEPASRARSFSGATSDSWSATTRPAQSLFANLPASAASASSAPSAASSSSSSSDSVDSDIAENGIQVKGTPSSSHHGYLTTTVEGTGTPGDHIVLYAEDGDIANSYATALYPGFVTGIQDFIDAIFSDSSNAVPPTFTAGTVTSLLPADPGTITVASDGSWSTVLTLKPGSYGFMAFAVDPTTKAYSAAGQLLAVHLTGTPIVDPAATTTAELAFTGSQGSTAAGLGGLAAVLAGAALLVVARRRRPRAE